MREPERREVQTAAVRTTAPEQTPVGSTEQGLVGGQLHVLRRGAVPAELDVSPDIQLLVPEDPQPYVLMRAALRSGNHRRAHGPLADDGDGLLLVGREGVAALNRDVGLAGREEGAAGLVVPGEQGSVERPGPGLVVAEHAGEVEDVPVAVAEGQPGEGLPAGEGVLEVSEHDGGEVGPPADAGLQAEHPRRYAGAEEVERRHLVAFLARRWAVALVGGEWFMGFRQ